MVTTLIIFCLVSICYKQERADNKRKAIEVTYLRRSQRETKRSRDTRTPYKSDRNPALTVKREIIPEIDPFSTPSVAKISRFQKWMESTADIHGM